MIFDISSPDVSTKFLRKRKIKRILLSILGILALLIIFTSALFHNELSTFLSFKEISDRPVYEVNCYGDYSFEKYLKTGANSYQELSKFLLNNIAHGIISKKSLNNTKHSCSAFFAKTPNGDVIFARNLDTVYAIPTVIKTNSKNDFRAIGMSNLYFISDVNCGNKSDLNLTSKAMLLTLPYITYDGINEKGLAAADFTVGDSAADFVAGESSVDTDKKKVPIYDLTVVRLILNKAGNLEEAIKLLKRYNIALDLSAPSHFMVADAAGNSAVIEFVNGKMHVIRRQHDYQIVANFLLYNNPKHIGFGSDRYNAYDAVLSKTNGIITTENALKLLEKNTISGNEQWSAVYNLTKRTVTFSVYDDYGKVFHYQLK